ncbi:hypothetical protein [Nonomuraea sp. NPDC049695]|uniref:hypothetical protein n=1 Tax=Nonomuraea sp. NPDC049695 TaxID=3154734 RepID=UPI00342BDB65
MEDALALGKPRFLDVLRDNEYVYAEALDRIAAPLMAGDITPYTRAFTLSVWG